MKNIRHGFYKNKIKKKKLEEVKATLERGYFYFLFITS